VCQYGPIPARTDAAEASDASNRARVQRPSLLAQDADVAGQKSQNKATRGRVAE
jgi:hypothetical protein